MNDDCLEHIFLYLSIEDLLNIAYTSKQLKPAAELAFSRNFGTKEMDIIHGSHGSVFIYAYCQRLSRDQFYRLLSSFGHLILKIKLIKFKPSLLKVLIQFSGKSITDLQLVAMDLHRMKKPFHGAETVYLYNVTTNLFCNPLNKLFSNVHKLDINFGHMWPMQIAVKFPHLNQLTLYCTSWARSYANMMRLNSQVQSLVLQGMPCAKYLWYASKHLKFLENLQIGIFNVNHDLGEDVNFPFLQQLKISLRTNKYMKTMKIPIVSSSLKEFTFYLGVGTFDRTREDNLNVLIDFFKK